MRYFFHVMNGEALIDEVGSNHPDLDAMRHEAIVSAGQMLSTGDQEWAGEAWQMIVADEAGTIVFGVKFSPTDTVCEALGLT